MIDLSQHNEEIIRDCNTWTPLNAKPSDCVMMFKNGSQHYLVYTASHIVDVFDDSHRGEALNSYAFEEDEFARLMNALNLDE